MIFGRSRPQPRKKVPILGVEGVGKSSLLFTLTRYISINHFGSLDVDGDPHQIMATAEAYVTRGEKMPATVRESPIRLAINRIPGATAGEAQVNVELTCNDIRGQDFRALLGAIQKHPNVASSLGDAPRELRMFCDLFRGCNGLLIVVDLIQERTPEEFHRDVDKSLRLAFADQVGSMMAAIHLAARVNSEGLANKPVFFVFTKGDKHGIPAEHISKYFDIAGSITLAQLRRMGANVKHYHVQAAEWPVLSRLEGLGFEKLVPDLLRALGAETPPR
jgi:GTPase SAR1 family protein